MLNDFETEIDEMDLKLDVGIKKMAKVLHISNGNYNSYIFALNKSTYRTSSYVFSYFSCYLSAIVIDCFVCPEKK